MRRPVHLEPILRRLPPDRVPPALLRLAEVAAAARAERPLPFQVGWSNPANLLRLRGGPLRELVPFLRLGDGGVVAMWLAEAEPAVVLLGIDGECRVIAVNIEAFLQRLAAGTTGVPSCTEPLPELGAAAVEDGTVPEALVAAFREWLAAGSALRAPTDLKRAEAARKALYRGARALVRDGLQRPHTLTGGWWSVSLSFRRSDAGWSVERLVRGKWLAVPAEYPLAEQGPELRAVYGHPRKTRFAVQVIDSGLVTLERDMELEPPPATSPA